MKKLFARPPRAEGKVRQPDMATGVLECDGSFDAWFAQAFNRPISPKTREIARRNAEDFAKCWRRGGEAFTKAITQTRFTEKSRSPGSFLSGENSFDGGLCVRMSERSLYRCGETASG